MKNMLLLILLLASFNSNSQIVFESESRQADTDIPVDYMTNISRYYREYELKDYSFGGDSSILNLINLQAIEQARLDNEDIEVFDYDNKLTIIIYSQTKVALRKKSNNLLIIDQ